MEKDDNRVNILGYSKSRLEVFLNGVIFLLIQSLYEAFCLGMQLPDKWTDKDLKVLVEERSMFIPIILLIMCYILINLSIFGGEGRIDMMQEKYGTFVILIMKLLMYITIILIASLTPLLLIFILF